MAKRWLDEKNNELHIYVEVDKEEWKKAQKRAFKKIASTMKVDGFRKGQIKNPIFLEKVRGLISNSLIWEEAISKKLLEKYLEKTIEVITEKDAILGPPTYQINKYSNEELEITYIFPLLPKLTEIKYKNLDTKFEPFIATKEDVHDAIENLKNSHAEWLESDEGAEMKDEITFDFEGKIDGSLFDGGSSENHSLKIGSNTFIPGFEERLVGFKKGDEKEVVVTFPSDYYVSEYAGKEATFKITVKNVKKPQEFILNEESLTKINFENVKSEDDLKDYFQNHLTTLALEKNLANYEAKVFAKIIENSEITFPRSIILQEVNKIRKNFISTLEQQGITLDEYKKLTKFSDEKLGQEFKKEAEKSLSRQLLVVEILRIEKEEFTEEDIEKHYYVLSKQLNLEVDLLKESLTSEQLRPALQQNRAVLTIIKYNDPERYQEIVDFQNSLLKDFVMPQKDAAPSVSESKIEDLDATTLKAEASKTTKKSSPKKPATKKVNAKKPSSAKTTKKPAAKKASAKTSSAKSSK